jgi:hypothetical protein
MPKPVTHPVIRAWLHQLARRIRSEGQRIINSQPTTTQLRATAAFGLIELAESERVYSSERTDAEQWCIYAAQVLEAAAGVSLCEGAGDAGRPGQGMRIGACALRVLDDGEAKR